MSESMPNRIARIAYQERAESDYWKLVDRENYERWARESDDESC